jgi:hypothetical protein
MDCAEAKRIKMAGEEAMVLVITSEPGQQVASAICGLMGMVAEVAMQIAELREDFKFGQKIDPTKLN